MLAVRIIIVCVSAAFARNKHPTRPLPITTHINALPVSQRSGTTDKQCGFEARIPGSIPHGEQTLFIFIRFNSVSSNISTTTNNSKVQSTNIFFLDNNSKVQSTNIFFHDNNSKVSHNSKVQSINIFFHDTNSRGFVLRFGITTFPDKNNKKKQRVNK